MNETPCRIGFAFCGSFCTFSTAMSALEAVKARFGDVTPIVSENSAALDTRFGDAHNWLREMERICDKRVIDTLLEEKPLDKQFRDHPLTGNYAGFRECHIQPDWLFIYAVQNDTLILTASRTGTHSDLLEK